MFTYVYCSPIFIRKPPTAVAQPSTAAEAHLLMAAVAHPLMVAVEHPLFPTHWKPQGDHQPSCLRLRLFQGIKPLSKPLLQVVLTQNNDSYI